MRFVDVRMLINEGISRVVPDELNGHIQFIFVPDTVADCRHLRAMIDSICPAEAGD